MSSPHSWTLVRTSGSIAIAQLSNSAIDCYKKSNAVGVFHQCVWNDLARWVCLEFKINLQNSLFAYCIHLILDNGFCRQRLGQILFMHNFGTDDWWLDEYQPIDNGVKFWSKKTWITFQHLSNYPMFWMIEKIVLHSLDNLDIMDELEEMYD